MIRFREHYIKEDPVPVDDSWRMRRVWHTTPTGIRNKVYVKSLPPDEQERYRPKNLKKKMDARMQSIGKEISISPDQVYARAEDAPPAIDFYYVVKDKDNVTPFEEDRLVKATDEASVARQWEDEKNHIAVVKRVPMEAIALYKDETDEEDDKDEDNFVHFPEDMSDEEKYEFVKFEENDTFLLNLFPYKEKLSFELSAPKEEDC